MAFETLKKKLPELAAAWTKEHWYPGVLVEVKVARRISPAEAKITFVAHNFDDMGRPDPKHDQLFSIYLHFYDGAWTTTRFDAGWLQTNDYNTRAAHLLMLAIDELGGK